MGNVHKLRQDEIPVLKTGRIKAAALRDGVSQQVWGADEATSVRIHYNARMDLYFVDVYCTEQSRFLESRGVQSRERAYQLFERMVARHLTQWETK